MIRFFNISACCFLAVFSLVTSTFAEKNPDLKIPILVLRIDEMRDPPLSRLELPVDDLGFAGAILGVQDNATTGAFLGHEFELTNLTSSLDDWKKTLSNEAKIVVWIGGANELIEAADLYPDVLFLNASSRSNMLRDETCRRNILHIAPSQNMITDAIAQFAIIKNWRNWFLVSGSHEADKELAESYRSSANKFGAKIVVDREFADISGARRTDTGHVLVQKQMSAFTQNDEDYDIMIAADASDVFAPHLLYNTWLPRPIAGSSGLRALTWTATNEAWGATQIQRRFERDFHRSMREIDYQTWLAVRVIGEAVTRINSQDAQKIREYLLSDQFEIAAFKGVKLNFRPWNGQLRQPILLSDERMLISVSPQEGFLHQVNQLDTLGTDEPENICKEF